MIENIGIGFMTLLSMVLFFIFIIAPLFRIYYGEPETKTRKFSNQTVIKDDGKFPHVRLLGDAIIAIYIYIGIFVALFGILWVIGFLVSGYILI